MLNYLCDRIKLCFINLNINENKKINCIVFVNSLVIFLIINKLRKINIFSRGVILNLVKFKCIKTIGMYSEIVYLQ